MQDRASSARHTLAIASSRMRCATLSCRRQNLRSFPSAEAPAFEALTPGRQRGYLFHFAGAKQSETRTARIEKAMPAIFEGRGFLERR
jgi:hypothetical protein